ncbi:hypothetical protein HYY75_02030 [bacterium]|nr:hypothetical protein [bacterium]
MIDSNIIASFFLNENPRLFKPISDDLKGRIYADLPHRYFADVESLKLYVRDLRNLGANVLLLLPHFYPCFSEYVVKDYERPCPLFGTWEVFAEFMKFVETLGMDRMIDIPFNHADWEAEHLKRSWYKNSKNRGIEAGTDDFDANGKRVRINWGAYELDNGNPELLQYWLEKVIFPHISDYNVNAIRIDAAWGLDPNGLATIIKKTKEKFPYVWFVAENLGMDRLINLASSGLKAGGDRYFNNFYWYEGGRYIPSDVYRFYKRSQGKPTCNLWSSHDVLMPAMRALGVLRSESLGKLNDKALHRQIIERDGVKSLSQLSKDEQNNVVRLMKLDFLLAAFLSTDLMWVAGSEKCLLERVDVLRSGPNNFGLGINSDLFPFIATVLNARGSDLFFNREGVVIPFGEWRRGRVGCKGYVKRVGRRICMVAVNNDLKNSSVCPIPTLLRAENRVCEIAPYGYRSGPTSCISSSLALEPGQGLFLYSCP